MLKIRVPPKEVLPIKFDIKPSYASKLDIITSLKTYIQELNNLGYLSASVDSTTGDSVLQIAHLFIGRKYEWTTINTDSVEEEILSRTGFRNKQFLNKPFSAKQISHFFNQSLTYLENNGYPFAEIKLAHVQIIDTKMTANVILTKNKFYRIDTIEIKGESTRLHRNYIENIIGVKSKQPYDERVIKNISKRIYEDPFMAELKPYEVIFSEDQCKLIVILKPKKANVFDGIIGIQPQSNSSKITLTGDVKTSLGNIVGHGERLNLRWQRLRDQTQQIDASIKIPFLIKTPIGFGYALNIYRRDTTFNNVHHRFTIPFRLQNGSDFHGFYDDFSTSLISTSIYDSLLLPPFNDAKNSLIGLGFTGAFVSNKFNPYSGWLIDLNGGAGTNKIIQNSDLESINYDSIPLTSTLLQGEVIIQYFQPITPQTTILFKINSGFKSTKNLVENQGYRIGGLSTLRGFDEQSIIASSFAVGTIEYRFLFDESSRLIVFSDWAWYELATLSSYQTDTPFSFGAGISFGTNSGIFSLNYALGSQFNNPVNFRSGKIHFGFVNLF